jgi:rRNA maturation endonuclease Nob1
MGSLRREVKRLEEKIHFPTVCLACGKPILPEFKICPYCGEPVKLEKILTVKDYK